ncbi:hypothetical protein NR402_11445 [Acidithiobacillus ferrooxidans]|uniref:hypothetical protein n=1 Tax=Acidithiobacillus ferrooxidans TaxID=920 RepID=UPI0019416CDA|nr:hypothetical protein [Acidithiobacillus ferrooxidans]MCR2830891.1 hypothetical protein [Acidithiobacillus ferrooxidans]
MTQITAFAILLFISLTPRKAALLHQTAQHISRMDHRRLQQGGLGQISGLIRKSLQGFPIQATVLGDLSNE